MQHLSNFAYKIFIMINLNIVFCFLKVWNVCSMEDPSYNVDSMDKASYTQHRLLPIRTSLLSCVSLQPSRRFESHIFSFGLILNSVLCISNTQRSDNLPRFAKLHFICHHINSFYDNRIKSWVKNSKAIKRGSLSVCYGFECKVHSNNV